MILHVFSHILPSTTLLFNIFISFSLTTGITVLLLFCGAGALCVTRKVTNICGASGIMYSCRNSHLKTIPRNVPSHAIALDVSENDITTLYDDSFTGLDNLRAIQLQRCNIHHIQKNAFQGLPHLCLLDLIDNQLSRDSVEKGVFRNMLSLQDLQIAFNFPNGGFPDEEITRLRSLQSLSLSANDLSRYFPSNFEKLKKLVNLAIYDIDASRLTNNSFENLAELPIEHLTLNFIDNGACDTINEDLLWSFPYLTGLRFRTLCGMLYAVRPLRSLQFRTLDYLDFTRTYPSNFDVQNLKEEDVKYLRNICVKNFILKGTKIVRIETMGQALFMNCLERIDLSGNMLQSSMFVAAVLEAPRIKIIDISHQSYEYCGPVDYNILNSIEKVPPTWGNLTLSASIEELNFAYTRSFAPRTFFIAMWVIGTHVQRVDISYSTLEVCSNKYRQLSAFLPRLSYLNLSGLPCGDLNVAFLKDLHSLSELYMRHASLNVGLKKDSKAQLLRNLKNLKVLNLSDNSL
jgi:hypothetical protein